jgi:hypothetical protein
MKIRDAYEQFFEIFPKEIFIKFGLENIITIEKDDVSREWKMLINKIDELSDDLYIRSFGRNGSGNNNIQKMYKEILNININFDPNNNAKPAKLLQNLTGFKKNKTIFNYQISHVFGNTKNVYCFTAPWNIIFIPKIIDPFTGHEAKGNYVDEFQIIIKRNIFDKFKKEIIEYNEIMEKLYPKIGLWVNNNVIEKERKNYLKDFEKINIGNGLNLDL